MNQQLAILCLVSEPGLERLAGDFECHYLADLQKRAAFFEQDHPGLQVILTNGTRGITEAEIDRLADLKIIGVYGAGFENIPLAYARERGIAVTHGPGTNSKTVADHAMALLLASARQIVPMHEAVQNGGWSIASYQWPCVYEKRLGILGLGRIGMEIAKRAAGFDVEIGYHNRSARDDVAYTYFDDLAAMAEWCDFLICASPGTPETRHLVNAAVLAKLGPEGILVNICRGSVVDTEALVNALGSGGLGGAGLDVLEDEPEIAPSLIGLNNLIITPHIAGRSPEATDAKLDLFLKNVGLCLSGQPVVTPIVERE